MPDRDTFIRTVPPRSRGIWLAGLLAGLAATVGILWIWRTGLPLDQRLGFVPYLRASVLAPLKIPGLGGNQPTRATRNEFVRDYMRKNFFGGKTVLETAEVPLLLGGLLTLGFVLLGARKDRAFMRELRAGRKIAGPDPETREAFNRRNDEAGELRGVGLLLRNNRTPKELAKGEAGRILYVPRRHETHHFLICGAPGTGKTQAIMQLMDQVQDRPESDVAIVWDPTGDLLQRYYRPERGDLIANPLDARCFSWCPAWELEKLTNAMAEAEGRAMGSSLYVGRASATESEAFFTDAAIALWNQIIVHTPPRESRELAYWMAHAKPELDRRVVGTKLEQDLDPGSTPQRNGIISSFTRPEQALAAIPTSEQAPRWTVGEWCEQRRGWIFFTTTAGTAKSLKPIQSLWLDMLIRRLMAQGQRPELKAPWFFFDELAELQRLPMLEPAMNQGRKFNLRLVLGFQAMQQVENLYGKDLGQAILAAPKTQIYMRTGESSSADWMSKQCGDQRLEELVESFPATWAGRSATQSVRTEVRERRLFIPSVFMGLRDMHGVLRYENSLVRIHLPHLARVRQTEAFVAREDIPTILTPVARREDQEDFEPDSEPERGTPEEVPCAAPAAKGRGKTPVNPRLWNRTRNEVWNDSDDHDA